MRNTIYPRHTLGKSGHAIFPVEAKQGLVQGITHIAKQAKVSASEISDFELLPIGEKMTFDEPTNIEILEFGGELTRTGSLMSELYPHRVSLEAGAILTGPIAWKPAAEKVESTEEASWASIIIPLFILAVILGIMAFMTIEGFFALLGFFVLITVVVGFANFLEDRKEKNIAKLGSVYVLAPKERHWA